MKDSRASTKKQLMEAAAELFAERGFDGVSVRDITGRANVNLGALTYHFGTKERLFAEVISQKAEPLVQMGRSIVGSRKTPPEKLEEMLDAYAMYILHDEPALKCLFAEMVLGGRRLPRSTADIVTLRNRLFIEVVKQGIKGGYFRKVDLESAAWNFFGMMSAYILYEPLAGAGGRKAPYPRPYVKRVVRAALDVFLSGIAVQGGKGKLKR